MVKGDKEVKKSIELISSIPGIGTLTAVTVLAETNGFELIRNKGQLTSYAGLDVTEKLSGTSVKGKPRISKKGNRHLRKAMYMPALAAIRYDGRFKVLFTRLVTRHGRMKLQSNSLSERNLAVSALTHEFEEYKQRAMERQTKLSRELQDERNKLHSRNP